MTRYVFRHSHAPTTLVEHEPHSDRFRYCVAGDTGWQRSDGKFSHLRDRLDRTCLLEYALMGWVE